jgi:hypothetical protein
MEIERPEEEMIWQPVWPTAEGSDDPAEGWKAPWPPMAPTALRAVSEIVDELERDNRREDAPFLVGTAAFWLAAISEGHRDRDSNYDITRRADPDGRVIDGLILARNAVAHGQVIVARTRGLEWPLTFPMTWGPWVWPESKEWPWRPRDSKNVLAQQESYAAHFANEPVATPLRRAIAWLDRPHKRSDGVVLIHI